ncbi:hypothetical protein CDV36_003936 [Fusarium kuroshium]|uniref:F-box domain-containing protein n=1 Tax=Fusarium kuroshium TaxID=2010991 RepID=A0A3M2SFS0_9HYPO|nr:hypothetical protein CDV36_003936 [Fusarium kuroshium]
MLTETPELSGLEQLPPELRRSILAALDLNQLKALIKSCPTFHQQFRHDRRFILGSVLNKELGSLAVDAYAVHLTSPAKFDHAHLEDSVPRFLKDYQRLRSSSNFSFLEQELTENDMSDLVLFYLSIIRPFTETYKDWALKNVADDCKTIEASARDTPLSSTEKLRIMRALYRLQLWCNLFGSTKHNFDEVHILDMFFGLYEPWEVEEIKSVHDFAVEGLDTGLDWFFDNTNSRIVASDGFYFHVGYDSKHQAAQCEPVHRVEMLPSSSTQLTALYTSLFNTIDECEHNFDDHLLGKVLGEETQNERRIIYPSARDKQERDQEPLPFKGDDPALPPVAWTHTWRGTYSNLFGAFMPDRHAEWGLMMWDEPRFRDLHGYEVVWYTCEDEWGIEDPRERFRDHEEDGQEEDDQD